MEQHQRVQILDVMRGFAVVVMVLGHSIDAVLSDEARRTDLFVLYDAVRGFTAPVFLFVAGAAFLVGSARRWDDYRMFSPALAKRLSRIALLFFIGYALHFPFFSLNKLLHDTSPAEYAQMLQVDVLHCAAAGLLLLQILVLLSPSAAAMARRATVLAALVAIATPFVWSVDWGPVLGAAFAPYVNQHQPSIFPLFPFAGFVLAGAAAGHHYLRARAAGREQALFRSAALAGAALVAAGLAFELAPVRIVPALDFWKTSPNFFLMRLGCVLLVTAGFGLVRDFPVRVQRHVTALGQSSLLVYAVHLLLVYGSAANDGLAQVVGRTLRYDAAVLVGLSVLLLMLSLVHGWARLRSHYEVPSNVLRYGLASTLTYFFLTKPW